MQPGELTLDMTKKISSARKAPPSFRATPTSPYLQLPTSNQGSRGGRIRELRKQQKDQHVMLLPVAKRKYNGVSVSLNIENGEGTGNSVAIHREAREAIVHSEKICTWDFHKFILERASAHIFSSCFHRSQGVARGSGSNTDAQQIGQSGRH